MAVERRIVYQEKREQILGPFYEVAQEVPRCGDVVDGWYVEAVNIDSPSPSVACYVLNRDGSPDTVATDYAEATILWRPV